MPDPLGTVLRLRRLAVDQARASAARAYAEASQAERQVTRAMDHVVREARAVPQEAESDLAGSFAAWLPAARRAVAEAEAANVAASRMAEQGRQALAEAQASLEAAEALAERRMAAASRHARRRVQSRLDELGHTRR